MLDKKNNNDLQEKSERKIYTQPLLTEIGKVSHTTRGSNPSANFDSCSPGDTDCSNPGTNAS